ncbi:MAG: DUF5777 family beta-barrel protein [Chitinophagaceae bacterium]
MLKVTQLLVALGFATISYAQDTKDIFKTATAEADSADKQKTELVFATFKGTRLMNGHTVETIKKGLLDFRISHRFGLVNKGGYEFFGLDNATERLGLDYGLSNRLNIGIGRSTYLKQMDGFIKYKLVQQATGKKAVPVTITLLAAIIRRTLHNTNPLKPLTANDKTSYALQAIIARKFNDKTSVEITPSLVHFNTVPLATDANDRFSLGFGMRHKVSKRISLNAEYYAQFQKFDGYYNSLALGVDIETGGHVFQLHFTNSTGMTEPTFIHQTEGRWNKGDIHFGFNISRIFNLNKRKAKK